REYQPDYFHLLRLAVPTTYNGETPDFQVITKLDSEARDRGEKIFLTVEDAAKDIYDFYDVCLIRPLSQDLERAAGREQLLRYFETEQFKKIPDNRVHSQEKIDAAVREIAT